MAKKVLLIVVGAVGLAVGLLTLAGGAAVLALGGTNGSLGTGYHAVSSTGAALVAEPVPVARSSNIHVSGGTATLELQLRSAGQSLFVGVGRSAPVQRYLASVPYDEVTRVRFNPTFRMDTRPMPGAASPAPPADQPFWVAQATGTSVDLSWPIADGSYRVVVMNLDGSVGISTDVRFVLKIPSLFPVGVGLSIFGGLLALAGVAMVGWGLMIKSHGAERTTRRRSAVLPPTHGGPPFPGEPPR